MDRLDICTKNSEVYTMQAQKLMSLSIRGYHLPKLVRILGQAAEWGSRVMDPLILNLVMAAESLRVFQDERARG